jgi:hypothetical protein
MKVQTIKNQQGKVIATYEKASGQNNASVEPVLPAGHKVEEMEVADDFYKNLKAFYDKNG